jgi:putative redox protein
VRATARRTSGYAHEVEIEGGHRLVIDEPEAAGGTNTGPSPTRTLAAALAACTAITCEMYAERKGWELGKVEVDVDFDFGHVATIERVTVKLRVPEPLNEEQRERLVVIAGKCPVHRALKSETDVLIHDEIESG